MCVCQSNSKVKILYRNLRIIEIPLVRNILTKVLNYKGFDSSEIGPMYHERIGLKKPE